MDEDYFDESEFIVVLSLIDMLNGFADAHIVIFSGSVFFLALVNSHDNDNQNNWVKNDVRNRTRGIVRPRISPKLVELELLVAVFEAVNPDAALVELRTERPSRGAPEPKLLPIEEVAAVGLEKLPPARTVPTLRDPPAIETKMTTS